jgi:SAM-dependent methyltransferase
LKQDKPLPFDSSYFDAVYSHMFYNMRFTDVELSYLFKESNRALKNNGLLYFSFRSDKDVLYNKGKKIGSNIYEINDFQIRFSTKEQIESFLTIYFEIKDIEESYEEPVSLYLVFCNKK